MKKTYALIGVIAILLVFILFWIASAQGFGGLFISLSESSSPQFSYCLGNDMVFNRDVLQIGCQGNVCTIVFAEGLRPIVAEAKGLSMYPSICNRDITIEVPVSNPEALHIGDIVSTKSGISHRIVNTCEGGFVLKGDYAYAVPDGCIPYSEIEAREVVVVRK